MKETHIFGNYCPLVRLGPSRIKATATQGLLHCDRRTLLVNENGVQEQCGPR